MARASWSGSVTFAGFPINVRLYPRAKSRSGESFKTLAPTNKQPVKQLLVDSDGEVVERADCLKGVEVSKGQFHALPAEAVEMIQAAERSVTLTPERFAPAESVDLSLSLGAFKVVPDPKVPGSEQPVGILWNGLRKSGRVGVVEGFTARAGSRDQILVLHAREDGLYANTLPYASELVEDAPTWEPTEDEEAAGLFEQVVENTYETGAFDHAAYSSRYADRRAEAVQAALSGEKIEVPEVAQAQAAVPDLMAAMQGSIKDAKRQSKPAKPKAKAKA